ncbi:MAG: hypothetical protein Q3962_08965 [Corynebacterium sp.]|nr:hypothetical protein [Corynebacterium sp.]
MAFSHARRVALAGGLGLGLIFGAGSLAHAAEESTVTETRQLDASTPDVVVHEYDSCELDPTVNGCKTSESTPTTVATPTPWYMKVLNFITAPFRWLIGLFH